MTYEAYKLMHDGILAFSRAEQQGIRVDVEYAENKREHLTRQIQRLEDQFKQTKFYRHWVHTTKRPPNIHSGMQLGTFLYKTKGIKPTKTTESGQGAVDEDALMELQIPELKDLIQIRKLKKVRDTYLDAFLREQVNGYIHPSFNLHFACTYRSSSDHPNFQNIPIRDEESMQICRRALLPRPGHQLLEVDFKAIEVSISCCYHKDPTMINYMKNHTSDMHKDMAIQIFKLKEWKDTEDYDALRSVAKSGFVFPEFYGSWYKNCAMNMACGWGELPDGKWQSGQGIKFNGGYLSNHLMSVGIKSLDQFTEHVKEIEYDFWNNRFPVYQKWKKRWWLKYQKQGYIDMLTGFRCSGVMSFNTVCNYPFQGSAFHCLLWSFNELDRIMMGEKWDSRLIGQIHDSVVFDICPDELEHVTKTIKQVTCHDLPKAWKWINTPMAVKMKLAKVDKSWAEIKNYEV